MASRPPPSRKRKPQPPVLNGLLNSYEDKDCDFVCPICFNTIDEPHMTKCGHTFCYKCIVNCLEETNRCPKCNFTVDSVDQIYPNFILNELIIKRRKVEDRKPVLDAQNGNEKNDMHVIVSQKHHWQLEDVNFMLGYLGERKRQLEADNKAAQNQILKEFLEEIKRRKQEQLNQLDRQVNCVEEDMKRVEDIIANHKEDAVVPSTSRKEELERGASTDPSSTTSTIGSMSAVVQPTTSDTTTTSSQEAFNSSQQNNRHHWLNTSLTSRRKRLHQYFSDLEECYFKIRNSNVVSSDTEVGGQLDEFADCLSMFTKYSGLKPLATLSYASDIYNGSSIVSSIEFDRDQEYFAIAGVTKKIKVFEYATVIQDAVDIHYPITEMLCNSKISSVCWNTYHKNMLASSDYEGTVTLWDAFTGLKTRTFQEHEKRCWSVDFNRMDPKLLASGSDDAKVKLWSTNCEQSISSLEASANVCCVKFNPTQMPLLAFGSADHCVHYYDLRYSKQALRVFKGHRKAVSYVEFANGEELVSASTDSQLKLWNVNKPHCLRTFRGHANEKNFVGLTASDNYIACGSENNSLYIYYKGLSKQLMTFKFDTVKSVLDNSKKEEDANEFVSAVCWRGGSDILVAANSQGTIKVLELL